MKNFNLFFLSLKNTKKNIHNSSINFLIKLYDGRLVSSSEKDNIIKIYNFNTFEEDINIKKERKYNLFKSNFK